MNNDDRKRGEDPGEGQPYDADRRRLVLGIVPALAFTPHLFTMLQHEVLTQPTETENIGTRMILIRDVFRCKPGKSRQLADIFKKAFAISKGAEGLGDGRVMLDLVTSYWTVVLELEVDSLEGFERHMAAFRDRSDIKAVMAGYMDLVEEGHREIFTIVQ
jgi:hypothetical protein